MTYNSCKLPILILVFAAAGVIVTTAYDGHLKYFGCNEKSDRIPACAGYVSDIKEALEQVTNCTKPGVWDGSCKVKVPDHGWEKPRVFGHGQCRGNGGILLQLPVKLAIEDECTDCLKAAAGYLVANCNYTEADVVYDQCSMSYSYRDL
ncbi:hypothetical protein LINGRAHAP2_LOCUS19579 [Linum grandiflorum]